TGSDDAAGGCFAFRAIRWIDGKRTTITGVVLGQPGHHQIAAGLAAADAMVDRIAGQSRRRVPAMPRSTATTNRAPQPSITAARPYAPTLARSVSARSAACAGPAGSRFSIPLSTPDDAATRVMRRQGKSADVGRFCRAL